MSRPALSFALLAALAAFALAAFAPGVLNDGDTYWHVRAGEWMIAHGTVLRSDPFSYTVTGQAWHTQEWLAEIVLAWAWRLGWPGVHLLTGLCAALTAGVVGYGVRRRLDFIPALLVTVLGLACITGSLLARPHMLALPLLALWTAGLVTARERGTAPGWWLLPLMPLWANLHGSFAFGLALALALGLEATVANRAAAGRWALFLAAALASALLTPFGMAGLLFPFQLAAMRGIGHIGEWQPSDVSTLTPFAIALLAMTGTFALGKVRVPPLRLLILLGITWMALAHGRHQMLFGVCAPLLLAPSLAQAWPAKDGSFRPVLAATGFTLLIALRLAMPVTRSDDPVSPATALAHVPRFLRERPVLNAYEYGGYLIWNGVKPFVDSRADLYGDLFLDDYARIVAPDKDALAATLAYYHVRWTIFPATAPVVKLLDAMPGWHRLYGDKLAVVHVRDDARP